MQKLTFPSIEAITEIQKRITEIVEHAMHCEDSLYAVEHLTELLNTSYSEGCEFGRNELENAFNM